MYRLNVWYDCKNGITNKTSGCGDDAGVVDRYVKTSPLGSCTKRGHWSGYTWFELHTLTVEEKSIKRGDQSPKIGCPISVVEPTGKGKEP